MASLSYPILLRDFIHHQLYDPSIGYFAKHVNIGAEDNRGLPEPLDFPSLLDEDDYRTKLKKLYRRVPGSWLTPVEIFSPWYGSAVADCIMKKTSEQNRNMAELEIFEIGGGSGTLMIDILTRIKSSSPKLFAITRYTCIEISPKLAEAQRKKAKMSGIDQEHWNVLCQDFLRLEKRLSKTKDLSFVLAFEVLDNLPHDKVIFDDKGRPWEAIIDDINRPQHEGFRAPSAVMDFILSFRSGERAALKSRKIRELFRPVSDPLISETLKLLREGEDQYVEFISPPQTFFAQVMKKYSDLRYTRLGTVAAASAVRTKQGIVYVPTGLLRFLKALKRCIPNHCLILSDFDALPGLVLPGASGPAVQSLGPGNRICERSSYLLDDISADIFFPTDFIALKYMYKRIVERNANIHTPEEFFRPFDECRDNCRTMNGYCPLIEDYKNTSYLLS